MNYEYLYIDIDECLLLRLPPDTNVISMYVRLSKAVEYLSRLAFRPYVVL
jgi:hypothetical protein